MVELIRKGVLPQPEDVPEALREAAAVALNMTLREPRPARRKIVPVFLAACRAAHSRATDRLLLGIEKLLDLLFGG